MDLINYKTLKLSRQIDVRGVEALVVSKNTHNFILVELVKKLELRTWLAKQFGVLVGNGKRIMSEGVCD